MRNDDTVHADDLQVGTLYHVRWDDCCTAGEFTARLSAATEDDLTFDNGVRYTRMSYGTEYTPVNTPTAPGVAPHQ